MWAGRGARLTALQISPSWSFVHRRWASGHREDVRAVPSYPPGRGSSWERTPMRVPPREMLASRARRASSLSFVFLKVWSPWRYAVILHLPTLRRMLDQSLNCSTMLRRVTMSSMVLLTRVPSSAYHLLARRRPQELMW